MSLTESVIFALCLVSPKERDCEGNIISHFLAVMSLNLGSISSTMDVQYIAIKLIIEFRGCYMPQNGLIAISFVGSVSFNPKDILKRYLPSPLQTIELIFEGLSNYPVGYPKALTWIQQPDKRTVRTDQAILT